MLKDISPLLNYFLYRPQHLNFDRQFNSGEWTKVIDHLMAAGYDFSPEQFSENGYLYRGMSCEIMDALQQQSFKHYSNSAETNKAEQIMQIYFVTHELSDAITASSLYDVHQDSAVLVFKSSVFNQSLQQGEAAILKVGDMGVIFRYPFLTQPLTLSDVDYIIVNESTAKKIKAYKPEIAHRILSVSAGKHNEVLIVTQNCLQNLEILAAKPQISSFYPYLRKYRKPYSTKVIKY